MIEIIERGTKKIAKCPYCGCRFSYEEEDVIGVSVSSHVDCPQCKKAIVLTGKREAVFGEKI